MSWRVRFFVVFAAAALVTLALAYAAERLIVENWQRAYLTGLAEHTVDRTDIAIDQAVIAMGAMIEAGHTHCGFETALASRRTVFETGGIRDIEVRDGVSICRAFNDSGVVPDRDVVGDEWLTARNHRIALARVMHGTADQLAVRWELGADRAITAVLNTQFLIFDILPAPIRDGAAIDLDLGASTGIVSKGAERIEPGAYRTFSATSSRYPTGVRIRVNDATLTAWSGRTDWLVAFAAMLAALATGYVVARAFVSRSNFADDFRAAIAGGEIIAHYQPIVALADERPVGFEMLARWQRRDGSFISPARFIPLVEMNDCADMLVAHLIRQADADLGACFAANRNLRLAVNITPCQLENPRFVDWLIALVSETGFARAQIVIEVTERQPLTSGDGGHAVSMALQEAGFEIALDDAGTGHNGLSLMKSLCANRVKIDKLFVDEIENDFRTRALVEMLVGVAKELEMGIVAEGIERREQAVILETMGVGLGQGYLFARPMPAGDVLAYIERAGQAEPDVPKGRQAKAA